MNELKITYLSGFEDMNWLATVHNIPKAVNFQSATLYGLEHEPSTVELHQKKNFKGKTITYVNKDGKLIEEKER